MKYVIRNKYSYNDKTDYAGITTTDAGTAASYIIDHSDLHDEYDDAIDEQGTVEVCGYEYYPSRILAEVDPVAYRCGLADYESDRMEDLEYEIDRMTDGDEEDYYDYTIEAVEEEGEEATA